MSNNQQHSNATNHGAKGPANGSKKNINEHLKQQLTTEMFAEVEETFSMVADNNGYMSSSKLPAALRALGMSLTEAEGIKIPSEGVDLDKFMEIIIVCMKYPHWASNEMHETFSIFDKDGSGHIDPAELRRVFTRLGENLLETELEDQLREVDIDGDLMMALSEFYNMVAHCKGSDFIFEDAIV